eukprot:1643380-Pleurochrysis_carterae.AAC.1
MSQAVCYARFVPTLTNVPLPTYPCLPSLAYLALPAHLSLTIITYLPVSFTLRRWTAAATGSSSVTAGSSRRASAHPVLKTKDVRSVLCLRNRSCGSHAIVERKASRAVLLAARTSPPEFLTEFGNVNLEGCFEMCEFGSIRRNGVELFAK